MCKSSGFLMNVKEKGRVIFFTNIKIAIFLELQNNFSNSLRFFS